jgi:hypothetical protein
VNWAAGGSRKGGTDSLGEVAEVASAWLGGIRLVPLGERFPFMHFSRLALGYESGTPVETAWDIILTEKTAEDDFVPYREMVVAALHADRRVRGLFPFFSHFTLRLGPDPHDPLFSVAHIDMQADGNYSVCSAPDGQGNQARLTDIGLANLTDVVVSLLRGRPTPTGAASPSPATRSACCPPRRSR